MRREKITKIRINEAGEIETYDFALGSARALRLGDKVERMVKPIAKLLKLPCLDKNGKLIPGTPCAKRRDALNKIL